MELLDEIYSVLKVILLSRTKEAEAYEKPIDESLLHVPSLRYDTKESVETLEKLINEFFNRNHWYDKLRVEYNMEWHHLMIKQPLIRKIKRNNPQLIVLKKIVEKVRSDTGTNFSHYAYATNLIDIPVELTHEYLMKDF